ncbi:protein CbbY [Nitrosomonas stercoris]|uniref:Protein CbbY n=1 Tax=Nitrosomonas stercoris TaxID=1444684 RepID=A0A4Y1YLZ7_9PROT|nr:protein CbbY [Nitrosomonas stercoris]
MPLSAVIFDVDGTLAETERDGHRVAFNYAFKQFQLDWQWDVKLYGSLLHVSGGKERIHFYLKNYAPALLNRNNPDEWIAQIHQVKTEYFLNLLKKGKIALRPGVNRLLNQLRKRNIRIAIATTTTYENVTTLLQYALGSDALAQFDVIGAGDIVSRKKPAADIYHWVLNQLGLSAQDCIAIEDSENGLIAASTAGIKTIITPSEYTQQQNFAKADLVLSNLENVVPLHNKPFNIQTLIDLQQKTL